MSRHEPVRIPPECAAYEIKRTPYRPCLDGWWEHTDWRRAGTVAMDAFHPESSAHRPTAMARVLYDDEALYVMFRVLDRYVRSVQTEFMGPVCTDSCVEFFVQPRDDAGYFNIEVNAGGVLLMSYVSDPGGVGGLGRQAVPLPAGTDACLDIRHDLPRVVEPEVTTPTVWHVAYRLPLELLAPFIGPVGSPAGQVWRGNFYKCGDNTSRPHWAAWCPVARLNFHQPSCFGLLRFDRP